jgi:glycosyltransferase involved in cell wall biosynthesis
LLLPNSCSEGQLLVNSFKVNPKNIFPTPIGVEIRFAEAKPNRFVDKYGINDFILFVGRIESRKNVLNLIKAFRRTKIENRLVIIGHTSDNRYLEECIKAAKGNKNIIFCGFIPHDSDLLSSAYAAARAMVLPSWYETPGIVALEAGLAGANLAITKIGGTTEYYKDLAFYIDPLRISSIEKALVESQHKEKTLELKKHILNNYTMDKAARRTIEAYKKILS